MKRKLLFIVNVDWFFLSHRLPIAKAAMANGYEVHVATGITSRLKEMTDIGLLIHPLNIERSSTNLASIWNSFLGMFQIIRLVRPDIVHLVTIKPVLLGGIAARLLQVPSLVAAVSGLGYVFLAQGFHAAVRRVLVSILYRAALGHKNIKVIFQNPDDLSNLRKLASLSDSKVALIRGSGVSLEKFTVRPHAAGPVIILLAARLLVDKGVREFVSAVKTLKNTPNLAGQHMRFVLVGEPDFANPASLSQTELDAWKQEGVVELWGHRNDMSDVLSASTIVVLPSYREGLPKVLIEAAACGRAVVTTDVPGCRDAIEDGLTGLLVPVRDASALAKAIQYLLENPTKCQAMGQAGRLLAERVFDVNSVVQQHLDIYDELLGRVIK